jgi:hypothetical protein
VLPCFPLNNHKEGPDSSLQLVLFLFLFNLKGRLWPDFWLSLRQSCRAQALVSGNFFLPRYYIKKITRNKCLCCRARRPDQSWQVCKSISKTKMKVYLNYLTKSFCLTMLRCMFQVDLLLWRLVSADYNNYPSVVHCFAGELLPLKIVAFITDCFIGQLINFTQSTVFWETENSKTQY